MRAMACALLCALLLPLSMHAEALRVTDGAGREAGVPAHARAVVLLGSYAAAYMDAGGQLLGATGDFFDLRPDAVGVMSVGAAHHPSLEAILRLDPQLVVLSGMHASHARLGEALAAAGIPCLYFQVTRYEQYLHMMEGFCRINGTQDVYEAQRTALEGAIGDLVGQARQDSRYGHVSCLLLRMYATGIRSKARGTVAGEILADMGLRNVADGDAVPDLLSMETIIAEDPDYIFLVAMGADSDAAEDAARRALYEHPAWAGLRAVRAGRVYVLDKRLFHNKPNADWPEAYAWVARTVYGLR